MKHLRREDEISLYKELEFLYLDLIQDGSFRRMLEIENILFQNNSPIPEKPNYQTFNQGNNTND
jgi:hypothetical protein